MAATMTTADPPGAGATSAVERHTGRPHGLDPVDTCIAAYFVASGLLLIATSPTAGHFVPLGVRAAYFVIFFFLRRRPLPDGRAWGLARRAYPIAIFPYFYAELAVLNQLVTTARFDDIVIGWEALLFHSQPSIALRTWWPWKPLSEYLHLGYFSYYLIPTFTVTMFAIRGKLVAVSETMTAVTLTFVACYAWFIFFPVLGPYHTYIPPDPEALGWVFPRITHALVRAGSSHGTAFPSSHVAVAVVTFIQAIHHDRRTAWVLVPFVPALIVGTVYGGFHYAIDALAGIVVALVMHLVARAVFYVLEARRRRATGEAD